MPTIRLYRLFERLEPGSRGGGFGLPSRLRRFVRLMPLWLFLLYPPALAWAADIVASQVEYQVKAAYLYKFAGHVEWPPGAFPDAGTPVTIGIVGADEMAAELDKLRVGRTVNNRTVEVKLLKPGDPPPAVQILFIGQQESGRLKRLLETIQSQPILTVTESTGALAIGSVINFVPVDNRIRFEVSIARAERSGLKISARLLAVAQRVESGAAVR